MSVLFMVGSGKESPDIVTELLDVKKHPKKPQYIMADPEPLVLYDCVFHPGPNSSDSQNKRYFDIIHASPYYEAIEASNEDTKYNAAPCSFDHSLTPHALQQLLNNMETHLFDKNIALTRYEQAVEALHAEYSDVFVWRGGVTCSLPSVTPRPSDYRELNTRRYTPLCKRTTARRGWWNDSWLASYEDRVRSLGSASLLKLKNRYQYVDLESNSFIPDVIKEKLSEK